MSGTPGWLPNLIEFNAYGGDWSRYINAVFAVFHRDFIASQPRYDGRWVRCRRDPIYDGKEAGFWHCTSEGPDEGTRTPDLRRCERIAWVRHAIEHADAAGVDHWTNKRQGQVRHLFWVAEEFLVVVEERQRNRDSFRYLQLITAFCTGEENRKRRYRKERDASRNG